ncbi:MAG: preprotein translocase subunit SecE [Planctomycetota bacterium]|nr:preprotein translocase subunit SecE [Planctomycetota bacterium]MDI6787348.1 preprotein translocase subunit SecE [Planctomycetota bacterium]
MNLIVYKQREGLIIRFVTWVLCSFFALFGCVSLFFYIPHQSITDFPPKPTLWGILIYTVPFFDFNITTGFIFSVVLFLSIVILINRFIINATKPADFLIETEFELKRVSWPPRNEYWGASVAVIISVIIIGLFIFVIDIILSQIMRFIYIR